MSKKLILISIIFISCIKFEFESPYEDANGIYLQWIGSYPIVADKMIIADKTGYFLDRNPYVSIIEKYIISTDSCRMISRYIHNGLINDFAIEDDYGFLAIPSYGLEIINFQGETPFLYGELALPDGARFIELSGAYAYIIGDSTFYIINISDKKAPEKLSEFKFAKKIQDFDISGIFAFIILEDSCMSMKDVFFILKIEEKDNPQIIPHSCDDCFKPITVIINNSYVYLLTENNNIQVYKWDGEKNLSAVTCLLLPTTVNYFFIKENQGFVLGNCIIYLLNLTYPDAPCVSEMINLQGNFTYGLINKNYIYALSPYLNIIEIKEIPK
ncbi:MAG: hypothetical protein ACPL28_02045 [bacterium]